MGLPPQICIKSDYLLVYIIISVGIVLWCLYRPTNDTTVRTFPSETTTVPSPTNPGQALTSWNPSTHVPTLYQVPPLRPYVPVNVPSRGYADFTMVGYAYKKHDKSPENTVKLYGRRINSNRFEYYVIHPLNGIKFPVETRPQWELQTNDHINIKGLGKDFKVVIYDYDIPYGLPVETF